MKMKKTNNIPSRPTCRRCHGMIIEYQRQKPRRGVRASMTSPRQTPPLSPSANGNPFLYNVHTSFKLWGASSSVVD